MLTCPMCKKTLPRLEKQCPGCRADLTLLADFVDHLQDGLSRAEALTKAGELGEAVWAYLNVLEVDPDNPTARRQVGQVATAIREFDRASLGRRWLARLRRQEMGIGWLPIAIGGVLVATALLLGYVWGHQIGQKAGPAESMDNSNKIREPRESTSNSRSLEGNSSRFAHCYRSGRG